LYNSWNIVLSSENPSAFTRSSIVRFDFIPILQGVEGSVCFAKAEDKEFVQFVRLLRDIQLHTFGHVHEVGFDPDLPVPQDQSSDRRDEVVALLLDQYAPLKQRFLRFTGQRPLDLLTHVAILPV
jgi:hypothetical protein